MQIIYLKQTLKAEIADIHKMTQVIIQVAIATVIAAVRDKIEVADHTEYSTRRNAPVSGPKADQP